MLLGLRRSGVASANPRLKEVPGAARSNAAWIKATGIEDGVLLLGGTSIVSFRIRVAQSELRQDLLPSFWSTAGLLVGGEEVVTVRMDSVLDASAHVERNGVEKVSVDVYDDVTSYPNIAVVEFSEKHATVLNEVVRIGHERNIVDLLANFSRWLPYVWGVSGASNPLIDGVGLPSATLIERAHALAGIDLSPGLPSAASCPEAIWQAARWWHESYGSPHEDEKEGTSTAEYPAGAYAIRQSAAAVVGLRDLYKGNAIAKTTKQDPLFKSLRSLQRERKRGTRSPRR